MTRHDLLYGTGGERLGGQRGVLAPEAVRKDRSIADEEPIDLVRLAARIDDARPRIGAQ